MSKRINQVNDLIRQELGQIILKEADFINKPLITITKTETSVDCRYSKVFITVLPESETKIVIEGLNKNIYSIQKTLDKRLYMRPVPKIRFLLDIQGEKLGVLDGLFKQL
ncbi:MAG: 30S ribosome-binding factor RbfA [Candidatus Paceibacterota bacterium]|jgi:ribosome-binding factor A